MKNYLIIIPVLSLLFLGAAVALAAEDPFSELVYPIPELGNCESRQACDVFCQKAENMADCLDFAEAQGLLPEEEIEMGRRMLAAGETAGPGGCQGPRECEAYCDNIDHIRECIAFAEEHNLIPADELEEARKVLKAIDRGLTPPNCKGKRECDVYCSEPANMEECLAFGEAAGLIPQEELADAKKMLEAVRKGVKPPACRGREECDVYCSGAEHMEECIEFGIAAGFIPPEEIENVKKTLEALKKGVKPPDCRGKEECDIYCSEPEHMAECMEFGLAAGFIPPEEEENARKTLQAIKQGFKPPSCGGKDECEAYCQTPEHMAECMEFAIAAGFMPPEEIENAKKTLEAIKKGVIPPNCRGEEECQVYCSQPEHMEECINFAEASGFMSSEEAERARQGGMAGTGGPGGCRSEEECSAYCQDPSHMRECIEFGVRSGNVSEEEAQEMLENLEMMERGPGIFGPPQEGGLPPEGVGPFQRPPEGEEWGEGEWDEEGWGEIPEGPPREGEFPEGEGWEYPMPREGQPPVGGWKEQPFPGGMAPPSPQEIREIQQQEIERVLEEMRQGQEGIAPGAPGGEGQLFQPPLEPPPSFEQPPAGPAESPQPQSLLDPFKAFLASIISVLGP